MFIFVGGNLSMELVDGIFSATLHYFHSVTNFNDQEMANLAESLPPVAGKKFVSTYDNIFGKGRQEGRQEGLREGLQEGLNKGLQEGLNKGLQEGLNKGLQEGLNKGLQEGLNKGLEKALLTFLKKFPDWTDEQVAATFEVELDTVQRVREQI